MQKAVLAASLLFGFIGGSLSSTLLRPATASASQESEADTMKRIDSIQTKRIQLVDDKYRIVMTLDSGPNVASLTIQDPDTGDVVLLKPGKGYESRSGSLTAPVVLLKCR